MSKLQKVQLFAVICRFPSWSVFAPLGAGGLCPDLAWGLLVSRGFFDAKAFFAVVREGVADKPG